MKKRGVFFRGVQRKTVALVLALMLAMLALFAVVSMYRTRTLTRIVGETRTAQQESITRISEDTMHSALESSLVNITTLQAKLADQNFTELGDNVRMLQSLARKIFENRDSLEPAPFSLPDPAMDGVPTVQVLCEEGVDYASSEYLGIAAHMSDTLLALFQSSDKIDGCYIGLADGTHLGADDQSRNRYDEQGNRIPFAVRERPWYVGAAETGDLFFSGIERDAFSGDLYVFCSAPVTVDGELFGVVGMDIRLNDLGSFVSSASRQSMIYIINRDTQVILCSEEGRIFSGKDTDMSLILKDLGSGEITDFAESALRLPTPLESLALGGREYYLTGAPMPSVGWAVIIAVDKELIEQPTLQMLAEYDSINDVASREFAEGTSKMNKSVLMLVIMFLLYSTFAAIVAAGRIVRPIEEMTRSIRRSSETGELFEMRDIYRTNDEIQILAESFDDLSKKTRKYIEDITDITREKERIGTELELASKIQSDMLPNIFPPFPYRTDMNIFASMEPAKEVGGDFYDFFLLDEDHLGLVMADVSGKGVPAALFMMISKILVQNYALTGRSPREVLEAVNQQICKNNREEMFITVWLGILDLKTGRMTASNAGHEYPVLCRSGGKFELVRDKHGFVIGGMDGARYTNYEMELQKGSRLFVYTDGVPEATNAAGELFGTERMIAALNSRESGTPEEYLRTVRMAINDFVGDAPQFDDITMLCLEYIGPEKPVREITVPAVVDSIPEVTDFVNAELEAVGCPMKAQIQIDVAIDEVFSNIANYAYGAGTGEATVRFETMDAPKSVRLTFIDTGVAYNPLEAPDPDVTLAADERQMGGLGVYLVKKTMDDVSYEHVDGRNILRITKNI